MSYKKWKSVIIMSSIITLVLFNAYVVFRYRMLVKTFKEQVEIVSHTRGKETALLTNLQLALDTEGNKLPTDLCLNYTRDSTISLQKYMKGKKQVLVVRTSDLYCSECNNYILQKMGRLTKELNLSGHILYMGNSKSTTTRRIMKYNAQLDSDIVHVDQNILNLPLDELGFPYCFILTEDLMVIHTFVPDKVVPEMTNFYLRAISKRYFN